jgi:hypothetical protein
MQDTRYIQRVREYITLVHGLSGLLKTLLKLCIGRFKLQSSFVDVNGVRVTGETKESSSLSTITLGPIRLQLDCLLAILEGFLIVLLRGIARGAVGVEDMVGRVELDSL